MTRILILFLSLVPFLLKAQVHDNFNDGDFTANPVWTGDVAEFTVNATQQLQLNSTGNNASFLSTNLAFPLANTVEWKMYVKQTFAGSASNYGRVYLFSDQANLEGPLNGYYLQFGEALSNDAIELFKQSGTVSTSVARGTNAQIAASFAVGVKVTRDASGLWTLYMDASGGTNYIQEASGTEAGFTNAAFFGVATTYTSTNANKFFYDNFSVDSLQIDLTPPALSSINVVSSTQLDVTFTEAVDSASAQSVSHYFVNNSIGFATNALRDAANLSLVHLTFSTPFLSGITDTLFVDSILDLNANLLLADTLTFTYVAPFVPGFKDIQINEIMADPTPVVGLPNAEFLELYNASNNPINIGNWSIADNLVASPANLPSVLLQPDSFIVLCASSSLPLFSSFNNVYGIASFPSLVNTGNTLFLKNITGTLIDTVNYLDSWYQDINKAQGGWTLELINPDAPLSCAPAGNWIASVNASGGTPGTQNSVYNNAPDVTAPGISGIQVIDAFHINVCFTEAIDVTTLNNNQNYTINNGVGNPSSTSPYNSLTCISLTLPIALVSQLTNTITLSNLADCSGNIISPNTGSFTYFAPVVAAPKDLVISEIYSSPTASSTLPNAEYLEIYNRSGNPIDLNNWSIRDDITITTPNMGSYILKPDSFVVLCSTGNVALFGALSNVLGVSSFPSLNNSGDHIYLRSNFSTIIDSVPYTDAWYRDALKAAGGWSLELINPELPISCAPAFNWIASSSANYGTPGIQNSVYSIAPDVISPSIISAYALDSLHVTLCFSEAVDLGQVSIANNYFVSGAIGNPISVVPSSDYLCVTLQLASNLQSQQSYTVTTSNLGDCSGNLLNPNTATFVYYTPVVANQKEIVITEIYSSPTVTSGLPNTEYIELYNRTNTPINIGNWSIRDDVTNTTANIPNFILFPDSELVICAVADKALFPTNLQVLGISSFPSLNNTGDHIFLRNHLGSLVDDVNYSDSWYRNSTKKAGGWSLELIDKNFTCNNKLNWIASTNASGGTPAQANSVAGTFTDTQAPSLLRAITTSITSVKLFFDEPVNRAALVSIGNYTFSNGIVLQAGTQFTVNDDSTEVNIPLPDTLQLKIIYTVTVSAAIADCAGNSISSFNSASFGLPEEPDYNDVVINEILYDPISGGTDYVEIYNRSNKVIDLSQLILSAKDTVTDELKSLSTIAIEGYGLLPEKYLLLSENSEVVKSQYASSNPQGFWQMSSIPSFNITDGTVVLSTPQQKIIDDLHYYNTWQFPLLVSTKGVSLERIDYNRSTQDASNWHSASQNVGFGTPAYRNSQYSENTSNIHGEVSVEPEVFSPDNDGFQDVVNITFKSDVPGNTGSISIFDDHGRIVRSLVKNELWGNTGTYSWDGITDDRDKARIGIYIILVEVFDLNGNTHSYKKTCVVGAKL